MVRDQKKRRKKLKMGDFETRSLIQIARKLRIPYGAKENWREKLGLNERVHQKCNES